MRHAASEKVEIIRLIGESHLDLSRIDAAPLIAFAATKETGYETEADGRISAGLGAYRIDQCADSQAGFLMVLMLACRR